MRGAVMGTAVTQTTRPRCVRLPQARIPATLTPAIPIRAALRQVPRTRMVRHRPAPIRRHRAAEERLRPVPIQERGRGHGRRRGEVARRHRPMLRDPGPPVAVEPGWLRARRCVTMRSGVRLPSLKQECRWKDSRNMSRERPRNPNRVPMGAPCWARRTPLRNPGSLPASLGQPRCSPRSPAVPRRLPGATKTYQAARRRTGT